MKKKFRKLILFVATGILVGSLSMIGCNNSNEEKVVIYTNADDEAVEAMKKALDSNGYENKYLMQSFGTSELGGKLLAEGKDIEADLITMSSFYIDSAQDQKNMFTDLTFDTGAIEKYPSYYTPITAQEGTIIYNTEEMKKNNLSIPTSIKDLQNPIYKGMLSITDIKSSSTAWLLIQALISEYGEDEAKSILKDIYANAGEHIESSGSAPIKKVRAGEVALGFGLRQKAVSDKKEGLPIDYVDPKEGNFVLTESLAVVDKGKDKNDISMKMAECIIKEGRKEIIKSYPIALYQGESTPTEDISGNIKYYKEKLTVDLLKEHQKLSEECK